MTGQRISDMTVLASLGASGDVVPVVRTGDNTNYKFDLAAAFTNAQTATAGRLSQAATRTALAALTTGTVYGAYLTEAGREGVFVWRLGNYSSHVSGDPNQAAYVASATIASTVGAWVRVSPDMEVQLEAFGVTGDGATNDLVTLKAAIAFQKALVALGIKWKLVGRGPDATYYVGSFNYSTAVALDYNNVYLDGRGAKIKYAQGNATGLFRLDYIEYVTGSVETLRGPVTIINFDVDFDKGAQFCCGIFCRYSGWKDLDFSGMKFRQSGNGTSPSTGDQWGVQLENYTALNLAGTYTDAADANARLHNLKMENNETYNAVQLTAGAGRGINGAMIINPYLYEPRANGIAITGISRVCRLDNIKVLGATVIRATGRAIYINHDNIGNSFVMTIGDMPNFQCYSRNVLVDDFTLIDCGEGIRLGGYVQGTYNNVIGAGTVSNHLSGVTVTRTDNLTVTIVNSIRSVNLDQHWAIDYHGSVDPIVAAAALDAATDLITLTAHGLPTCGGVVIIGEAGATMPAGVASGVPYFVKSESANTFSIWEGVDETTGTPVNQVNIGAGAVGNFTISFVTIVQNMLVSKDANVSGGDGCRFASMRNCEINGHLGIDFQFGMMADVTIGALLTNTQRNSLGGTLRVAFRNGESRIRTVNVSTFDNIMTVADATAYLPNYDIEFVNWRVIVDGASSLSTTYPRFFLKDTVTAANRRGRGWGAVNTTVSLSGASASFTSFGGANFDNCFLFEGNISPELQAPTSATAATLTVTLQHGGRIVTLNRAAGVAVTLPAATGSGIRFRFIVGTTFTTAGTIKVTGNDIMAGLATLALDGGDTVSVFATAADSDTITMDGTTTGGIKGADVELIDIAADTWWVNYRSDASGAEATPFSATV